MAGPPCSSFVFLRPSVNKEPWFSRSLFGACLRAELASCHIQGLQEQQSVQRRTRKVIRLCGLFALQTDLQSAYATCYSSLGKSECTGQSSNLYLQPFAYAYMVRVVQGFGFKV